MFFKKYRLPTDDNYLSSLHDARNNEINNDSMIVITPEIVKMGTKKLKPGKDGGNISLKSDHLLPGGHQLHVVLSMFFNTMLIHGWGKQKETLMATYKVVMRPALEYASSVWSPIASSTSINKLQVMQNAALRTATGCTQHTNIQHLHDETLTLTLPIHEHLQLHASQYKQKTQHPSHPLHKHTTYFKTPRL